MRLPIVLQADRAECGLACLAMVAGYFGHRASLHEYRRRFRVSLRGTTLLRLRQIAEQLGLRSRAVRLELGELRQLRTPAVLHWNLNHFVVLKSVRRRHLRIVDPAVGLRETTLEDAGACFTGVALELVPTPAFAPRKEADALRLSSFLVALRGLGKPLAGVFALIAVLQMFALLMPLNMQFTVDHGIRQGDMHVVFALAIGFGLLHLTAAALDYFRGLMMLYVGNTSAFRIVTGLARHMIRLPDEWFDARHTGDIMSRFQSTKPIRQFLTTGIFALVLDSVLALGALAMLLAYSWDLTLAVCAFLCAFAALNLGTFNKMRNLTHESITADAQESTSFIENVERHRAIKVLGVETQREDIWGAHYVDAINASARLARFRIHVGFAGSVVGSAEVVVMLLLGAAKVIGGDFTLGQLFAFTSYGGMFAATVHGLIDAAVGIRMLRLHQERLADIGLAAPESNSERVGARRELIGRVETRALSFAYGDDEPRVIDGLDLAVSPGEFVAVAGRSGVGKTTFVKLICKLLVPTSGEVLVDGVKLNDWDATNLRQQIGVVMQDDDLFSGSLLDNIIAGGDEIDEALAEAAARAACIHDEIAKMPMRYATLVGHMGSTLSGGQQQRVMIARALYRRPKLLILDEGTAHLDEDTQDRVLNNLPAWKMTVIAVSHDARLHQRADRVIWL